MRVRKISFIRRIVQVFFLLILIYGGYIFKTGYLEEDNLTQTQQSSEFFPVLSAPQGYISTDSIEQGSILWPSGDTPVLENYPPSLICRFNPRGGMFKACIVHFFSENFTWRTPLKYMLPHISIFVLLCFLFARFWCGWVCPLGTVGDFLTWLRQKMNIPVRRFPESLQRFLRLSSYSVLGLSFSISTFIGIPNFARFQCYWFLPYCQICPARLLCPLFGLIKPSWKEFSTGVSSVFTVLSWIMLALFAAGFYWGKRIWCHFCPVGLMNSWFNKGAAVELKKKALKCNKCGCCANSCPMGLSKMYTANKDVIYNQSRCIMCLRCVEACPRDNCLSLSFLGKRITQSKY